MHSLKSALTREAADRNSRERGAVAVIFAFLLPVLFGSVALALDVGKLVYERQHLSNALDAAALAGAASLPNDPVAARNAAISFAKANDPAADPAVSFWCMVASTGAAMTVNTTQIPSVCDPGTIAGAKCNEKICAIPCTSGSGHTCNTITVTDDKPVPFAFAPVIGIDTGSTGSLASDACKGSCGAQSPNPMDIALIADRTSSMSPANLTEMKTGIKSTLLTMSKDQQYVALGTIHRSSPIAGCVTNPSGSATSGPWMPVPFSHDYTNAGSPVTLNTGSDLVKGVSCLSSSSGHGTYLAAPLKSAARYVLGKDANNLALLPPRLGTPRKVIILETDGQPNENSVTGSDTNLNNTAGVGSSNEATACNNLKLVAEQAKAEGILIITVGFGGANTESCGASTVRAVLASVASPKSPGVPSTANNDCQTATKRATENADGDFFFCAATGAELGPIFVSAINAASGNSHLVRIPD